MDMDVSFVPDSRIVLDEWADVLVYLEHVLDYAIHDCIWLVIQLVYPSC